MRARSSNTPGLIGHLPWKASPPELHGTRLAPPLLIALAATTGALGLFAAWAVLGVGMALGLYDAGFATLTALYGSKARGPITGITLFAGFASTVSWPLSTFLNDALGWRETCLVWAALNVVVGLPLNRLLLPIPANPVNPLRTTRPSVGWKPYKEMFLLAFVFASAWFVTGSMGGASAEVARALGCDPAASDCRGCPGWAGPGGRAPFGISVSAPYPSADLGAHSDSVTSDRRCCAGDRGGLRGGGLLSPLWRWKRAPHHCARHRATGNFRPSCVWRAYRHAWCARPRCPSFRPLNIWALARRNGPVGHTCLDRSLHRRPGSIALPEGVLYQIRCQPRFNLYCPAPCFC
jgi:hypothetical protein